MGGADWRCGEWAGVRRGLYLLVHRQVPQGVGSVSEYLARSVGAGEWSSAMAMIQLQKDYKDVIKRLAELDAKMSVLWQKHMLDQGESK